MLAIRMQRNGRSGYPVYRIVVQEAQRHPLSGRIVAQVGSYNPHTKSTILDKELVTKFLKNGAQPSTRVVRVLQTEGIEMPDWVKLSTIKSTKSKHADKLRKNQPKSAPVAESTEEAEPAEAAAEETPAEVETAA